MRVRLPQRLFETTMHDQTPSLFAHRLRAPNPTYAELRQAVAAAGPTSCAPTKSTHACEASAPVRSDAPHTSREAADAMGQHVARMESIALSAIRLAGEHGLTFDELASGLGWPQSQSGRVTALLRAGLIADSGRRRPTRAGHSARVYVATK